MDDTNVTVFGERIDGPIHMLSFQDILLTSLLMAAAIIGVTLLLALCYDYDNDEFYNNDILKPDKKDNTNDDDFKIKVF
nr:MAG TPA: hypothetical protein [Caudoviricetes sp.]